MPSQYGQFQHYGHSHRHKIPWQLFLCCFPDSRLPKFPPIRPSYPDGSIPHPPYLPNHGFGQHLCSPRATQHVSRLQEDLRPVLDRFQVPFLPRCQGGINGFVNEVLRKKRGKAARGNPPPGTEGKARGHPPPGTSHSSHLPIAATPNLQLLVMIFSQVPWDLESQHPPLEPLGSQPEQRLVCPPDSSPPSSMRITPQTPEPHPEIKFAKSRQNAATSPQKQCQALTLSA